MEEALEQGPQAYGLPMTTWTLRDLQALLLRERGLRVGVCTLHRVGACLGLSLPSPPARSASPPGCRTPWRRRGACSSGFKKKPTCIRTIPAALGPHLVYLDECEIHTHPHLAQVWPVWRKKGHPMRIPAAGADQKCAIFGALDYASGRLVLCPERAQRRNRLHDLPRAAPPGDSRR